MVRKLMAGLKKALIPARPSLKPAPKHFLIEDYIDMLQRIRAGGAVFEHVGKPSIADATARRVHYMKHDIHHDLENTYRMAVAEAKAGIVTTYFMMPLDPLNEAWFEQPETWDTLRAIRDLGHEMALHVCGFTLIEQYGDLGIGLTESLNRFRREGFEITTANTHGHSSYSKKFSYDPMNFYVELARPTAADDPFWMSHYAKYSLLDFGIRVWADTSLWIAGHGWWKTDYFVSDNSSAINAGAIDAPDWEVKGKPFDLSPAHRAAVAAKISQGSCLYLIHPQSFRPAQARG